jgi:zinc protease
VKHPRRVVHPWRRLGAALLAAGVASCGTTPFRGETGIRPFAFDLWDVHCPSGMRVIFERAPGAYTVGVTAVVGAGSVQDPPGKEGLAHLVEHLTFRARDRDGAPMHARLWSLGASYNAETEFDSTTYHEFVPRQSLRDILALEGKRLADPLQDVDETIFAVERDVVRNELRETNETHSWGAAFEAAFETAFPAGHPYARPVGGTHGSLSNLTLDDARRFVAQNYRPENVTMVVVGDMDLSTVDAFVRGALPPTLYGDPAHPRPIARPPTPTPIPPAPPGGPELRHARAHVMTPEIWISWTFPGGLGSDLDVAKMWSIVTSSNFYRGRFKDTDIAGVDLFPVPGLEASLLIARVHLTDGAHAETSFREVVSEMPWIGGDEIYLEHRINNLKLGDLRELAFEAESVLPRSLMRASYTHLTGDPSAYAHLVDSIKSITADRARDFADRYLGAERARAVLVEPWGDGAAPKPLPAAADPAIDRNTPLSRLTLENLAGLRPLAGLRTSKLDNGLELVVLPRPGAPVVTATLAFHGDRISGATGLSNAADAALEYHLEESPGDYGISYSTGVGIDLASTTVRAGAANLPRALDMLSFGTRSLDLDWPSDKFREVRLPFLRRIEASPQQIGERAVWRALFPTHPFGRWATVDQIVAHPAREVEDWLAGIVTARNGVLVVVGDVDPAAVEAAARSALSNLDGSRAPVPPLPVVAPATDGLGLAILDAPDHIIITHRPGATQAELNLRCVLPPADARVDVVHNVAADIVQMWFEETLRRQTGSTYGAHAWSSTLRGGTSIFHFVADIDNGRFPLAVSELRRFWRGVVANGAGADNVRRSRDSFATSRLLRYETSGSLAREIVARWNLDWPLASIDDAFDDYSAVRVEDVDETLRTCARNLVVGVTGDAATIRAAFTQRRPAPVEPAAARPPRSPAP